MLIKLPTEASQCFQIKWVMWTWQGISLTITRWVNWRPPSEINWRQGGRGATLLRTLTAGSDMIYICRKSSRNLHIRDEIVRPRVQIKIWCQRQLKHLHWKMRKTAFPLARPKYTAAPKSIEATVCSVHMALNTSWRLMGRNLLLDLDSRDAVLLKVLQCLSNASRSLVTTLNESTDQWNTLHISS